MVGTKTYTFQCQGCGSQLVTRYHGFDWGPCKVITCNGSYLEVTEAEEYKKGFDLVARPVVDLLCLGVLYIIVRLSGIPNQDTVILNGLIIGLFLQLAVGVIQWKRAEK